MRKAAAVERSSAKCLNAQGKNCSRALQRRNAVDATETTRMTGAEYDGRIGGANVTEKIPDGREEGDKRVEGNVGAG